MNLDEWAREIHKIAVEHGWWDEERNFMVSRFVLAIWKNRVLKRTAKVWRL